MSSKILNPYTEKPDTSSMRVDPGLIVDRDDVYTFMPQIDSLKLLENEVMAKKLSFVKLVKYVIFLYSEDTVLNIRPLRELKDRKQRAAILSGFMYRKGSVDFPKTIDDMVFNLGWESFFNVVMEYYQYQSPVWAEISTLQQQIWENHRFRMMPATSVQDFAKKDSLTKFFREWNKQLTENIDVFYSDHDDLKAKQTEYTGHGIESRAR